jgi:protein TonB
MPERARRAGTKGTVTLLAKVNADGTVGTYTVLSGQPQFTPAAVDAVRQWRYQPYYHNGQPAPFQTQITIQFPSQPAAQ